MHIAGIVISILLFIISLLILIGIHEYGHFVIARLCGIKVLRFSIGFGKALFSWHDRKGTEWVIAALPIGGYVKLLDEREDPVNRSEQHLAFNRHSIKHRLFVMLGGPLFNVLFAIVAFWLMFVVGIIVVTPLIGSVLPNTAAAQAGLRPNTIITKIDRQTIHSWQQASLALITRLGSQGIMQITTQDPQTKQRSKHQLALSQWQVDPIKVNLLTSLGIKPYRIKTKAQAQRLVRKRRYSLLSAWGPALQQTWIYTRLNYVILWKLITGQISLRNLGGPLSLFQGVEITKSRFSSFLQFLGLISISLAIINLLPIPGLDGGHILFLLIEVIRGKALTLRMQGLVTRLGIILLVVLLIHATANDLARLFS